jgi:putative ABC transport system ATP-binding protein
VTGEPLVRCTEVARTFGSGMNAVVAVHGANCAVHAGQRIAVTGPSGCGKSTLLHLMAGVERPTSGSVTWPGLAVSPPAPAAVGLVFQSPNLLADLDVLENVTLPMLLLGTRPEIAKDQARQTLARVGIADLEHALPEELSGGQGHRASVARALAPRPRLVLADEPTGKLDRDTGRHLVSVLLETAADAGAALVVATHDSEVIERLDIRWTMRDGALSGAGSAVEAAS